MEKYALMAAAFGALAITAASGLLIIPALRRLHFGQTIKEIGPTWHQGKNGTPTMGGLTFYLGVLVGVVLGYTVLALSVPSLLGGWLSGTSVSLFIGVLTAYAFGLVGFVDDYIKVVKKRNLGLIWWQKVVAQVVISLAFSWYCYKHPMIGSSVIVPFFNVEWDLGAFYVPLMTLAMIFMVNSSNLQDGRCPRSISATTSIWRSSPWRWRAAAWASCGSTTIPRWYSWATRAVCSLAGPWWA